MVCSRAQNLLSAYCDREVTGAEMLQIRSHLDSCAECRREYEALLQVKRLLGNLSAAAPPRPFDPAVLDAPSPRRRAWTALTKGALGQIGALTSYAGLTGRSVEQVLRPLHGAPGKLALTGLVAVALATAALLRAPQHADAVTAHVPAQVVMDERAVVFMPLDVITPTVAADPLPDELRAVHAAQVLGAEAPIRPVMYTAYDPDVPAGFSHFRPHTPAYYPGHFPAAGPVTLVGLSDGFR